MTRQILILGATGMLGRPVVRCLVEKGHRPHLLVRDVHQARRLFGETAVLFPGTVLDKDAIGRAMAGCDAAHINLTMEVEFIAAQHLVELANQFPLERISYVSATTPCQENRWFQLVDVKMRTEALLGESGLPTIIFCPTWAMETLQNFIQPNRAAVIRSKNPPPLHFFAAADFGRMVAAAFDDDRALGKRLFIHGPEAFTLPQALKRFIAACHPDLSVMHLALWQAQLIGRLPGRQKLAEACRLIAYFDRVGELGDPVEANALLGAPAITLAEWFQLPKGVEPGYRH